MLGTAECGTRYASMRTTSAIKTQIATRGSCGGGASIACNSVPTEYLGPALLNHHGVPRLNHCALSAADCTTVVVGKLSPSMASRSSHPSRCIQTSQMATCGRSRSPLVIVKPSGNRSGGASENSRWRTITPSVCALNDREAATCCSIPAPAMPSSFYAQRKGEYVFDVTITRDETVRLSRRYRARLATPSASRTDASPPFRLTCRTRTGDRDGSHAGA